MEYAMSQMLGLVGPAVRCTICTYGLYQSCICYTGIDGGDIDLGICITARVSGVARLLCVSTVIPLRNGIMSNWC